MNWTKVVSVAVVSLMALSPQGRVSAAKDKAQSTETPPGTKEKVTIYRLFDFEIDLDGWRIPEWAFAKPDNAGQDVAVSSELASHGKQSIKVPSNFLPKMWSAAYVEIERTPGDFYDFSQYDYLMADVYLPKDAPEKLKGEIILTVGEDWAWTEMRQGIELKPGAWTTIKADISGKSTDWKVRLTDPLRSDVRKLGVRVVSNHKEYKNGVIYVDNVRLGTRDKK